VAARQYARVHVCGLSLAELAGSSPVKGMDVCLCEFYVLLGGCLCVRLITLAGGSYGVCECD
jgi:hypothetical protein